MGALALRVRANNNLAFARAVKTKTTKLIIKAKSPSFFPKIRDQVAVAVVVDVMRRCWGQDAASRPDFVWVRGELERARSAFDA